MKLSRARFLICTAGAAAMMTAVSATAQEFEDEVIATGIRSSLKQSLDVKRGSDQVVDAITAEDVGKFPDNNIAESLQRITGVAIDRDGGEGQFITVRGLGPQFNLVTLNGRTLATDNAGREFSFDTISSDIISRAEVFKTATPNLQSGGIGANVNIVTASPLDRPGTHLSLSAAGIYDDLSDEFSPDLTAVGSWTNEAGNFGALLGVSYSDRSLQRDRVFTNGFALRQGDATVDAPPSASGLTADDFGELPEGARLQQQAIISRDQQDRERLTLNGTVQFEPVETFRVKLDGLWSSFDISSFDNQFSGFFTPPFINPVVDENGTVTSFSRPGLDFQAANPAIADQVGLSQNDNVITANNRDAESYLFGGNVEWDAREDLTLNFDVSYSEATRDATNPFVVLGALAPASPLISLPDDAEITTLENIVGAQDTSIQRLHFVNVNRTEVDDQIFEIKGGGDWNIDQGILQKISFGGAYSDREKSQTVFDNFAPTQGTAIFCAFCGYTVDFDDSILSPVDLGNFLSGVDGNDRIPTQFLGSTFEQAFAALNSDAAISDPNRSGRPNGVDNNDASILGTDANLRARRDASNSIFGFFDPEENPGSGFAVDEEIIAAFVNTVWAGDLGDIPWTANLGFRWAQTNTTSAGVDQPVVEFRESPGDTQLDIQFGDQTDVSVSNSYSNFLPSFNLKLETSDSTVARFAVSQTVTRPTLTSLGVNNTFGGRSNAPTSGGGNPNLEAFESTNFDIAFEWYIDDISYFGVTGFHKRFSNFLEIATLPVAGQVIIPPGNVGNPGTADLAVDVTFQDTRERNGETGDITGLEAALQKGWDNGLGFGVNYTYVTSNINRGVDSPVANLDFNGLSPHSLNINGFYEKGPIQARVAWNWRDEFLFQAQSFFGEPQQREAFGQIDFSAGYDITDRFQVFVEGVNVLGATRRDFSRFRNRFLELEDTGARYTLGIRGTF